MGNEEQLHAAIGAIHAAGAQTVPWQDAMNAILAFSGARAVTLDSFDRQTLKHTGFHGAGMRPSTRAEYTNMGGAVNARAIYGATSCAHIFSDREIFGDESGIDRDPFYNNFLVHHDVRYMAIGRVAQDANARTFLSFCRSPKMGPVDDGDFAGIERLVPHLRQALFLSARLSAAERRQDSFSQALEWLHEGVALIDGNGRIVHANAAFEEMVRAGDGLHVSAGEMVLDSDIAQHNLGRALGCAIALRNCADLSAPSDFIVPRPSGLPPYAGSVRPVFARADDQGAACAILFLRDPLQATDTQTVAHLDLTPAEADLANALMCGLSPSAYARQRRVSINTVYTHLRRIKEKLGGGSLTQLIRKLNAARAPARPTD